MPGVGTNPAITPNRDVPVLLDLSRLVSRVGYGPHTGIDRVELAYLDWCLSTDAPFFALVRTASGFSLLDRDGAQILRDQLAGKRAWGNRDLRALVGLRTPPLRGRAEAGVRRLSVSNTAKKDLFTLLGKVDLNGFCYLNTGHSTLAPEILGTIRKAGCRVVVMIHDLIPLEFPEFQNPTNAGSFERKLKAVCAHADLIVTNSNSTSAKVTALFSDWGRNVRPVASHLGVEVPVSNPAKPRRNRPYLVAIGTIEPRKNHQLLLDIWDAFDADGPELHIVGRRGWNNKAVFERLDRAKGNGLIFEHSALPDADLWPLLQGSRALLFPSFAEGFGLPSLEAAALGVPVICGDLSVHRELLGAYPIYADSGNMGLWKQEIEKLLQCPTGQSSDDNSRQRPDIPSWGAHFAAVNAALATLG
ncbi:MAG: glycosyltransferase family 4 protein [Paracoccaceae bacterium]